MWVDFNKCTNLSFIAQLWCMVEHFVDFRQFQAMTASTERNYKPNASKKYVNTQIGHSNGYAERHLLEYNATERKATCAVQLEK